MLNKSKKEPPWFDPLAPVVWRDHETGIDYIIDPARWPGVVIHNGLDDGLTRGAAEMLARHAKRHK